MPDLSAALAAAVVVVHVAFVAFATVGGIASARWPRVAWVHVPCALWAVYIELSGGICPLTPLENALRAQAGLDPYSGDFVARYVFPLLYPSGLTRGAQIAIGALVLGVNAGIYGRLLWKRRR